MSAAGATSTVFTVVPLMSRPMISPARSAASSGVAASFTPPALPRPPTSTWALTTTGPPMRSAAARASSGVVAVSPSGERDAVAREDLLAPVLLELHAILLVRLRSPARALGWGLQPVRMDEDCSRVSPDGGVDGGPGEAETARQARGHPGPRQLRRYRTSGITRTQRVPRAGLALRATRAKPMPTA